jgi:hypothetical protein
MSALNKSRTAEKDAKSTTPDGRFKRKDYERELARLHVELVKLQRWVQHTGGEKPHGYKEPDYPYKFVPELSWPTT